MSESGEPQGRPETAAPAIELRGISKAFGPVQANKDIAIRVMPGTIHGIIGENGAGKSTLMSILYGFYKADKGQIFINGKETQIPDSQAAIAAGIGMVFQHFKLVENFTVLENVVLGAEEGGRLMPSLRKARTLLTELAKEGKLAWKAKLPKTDEEKKALEGKFVFAPDSVHPHVETGHELYLQAIVRSLEPIAAASKTKGAHTLGQPFIATNYEQAKLVPITAVKLSSGFQPAPEDFAKRWSNRMSALHKASNPGDTISFKFKGTRCSIYDIVGPDGGQVIVTVDDQPARIVPRFDAYCTYHRLSALWIGSEMPDTVHTVKIEIHPDQPDKAAILAKNGNKIDKPERFDGTAFYPGAIMLVGEIVE